MDNQDRRKIHSQGHEDHGVHVCHKCGWPFPNPHPSAKHRRAHKRICGTIEGYRLLDSEGSTYLNGSDDERLSDDERKLPSPKVLEKGINEKGRDKIGEKLNRSEDEVFSDAVADFSDGGLSLGIEERFHESSGSAINEETIDRKDKKNSEPSEDKGFDAVDVSKITAKSSDDCRLQNPEGLQREGAEEGNTQELQSQLLGTTSDLSGVSVSSLITEESTVVCNHDGFGLSSYSCPSKAEATSDVSPENETSAGKNVIDRSLMLAEQETTSKGKDEFKSDRDVVGIAISPNNIVNEVCGVSVPEVEVSNIITPDHKVVDGAVELKEKVGIECCSVLSHDDLPLEVNSLVSGDASSNGIQVDAMPVLVFVTSTDSVKTSEEKEEGNVNVNTLSMNDGIADVSHPQSEFEDFKDHEGIVLQNPLMLHSSETLKHEEYDLKESAKEETHSKIDSIQLRKENDILSPNMHNMESGIKQKQDNSEAVVQEILSEEQAEVSPVKLPVDGCQRSDEIGASGHAMKSEIYESHLVHSFGGKDSDDVYKSSQQMNLLESSNMVSSDGLEDFKDQAVILNNPSRPHSFEALKQAEDDLKDAFIKDCQGHSNFNSHQLTEESEVLSPVMHVLDDGTRKEQVNCELMVEEMLSEKQEISSVKLTVDDNQISGETGSPSDTMKCVLNESNTVYFSGEQECDDVCRNSRKIDSPEGSVMASFNRNLEDTPVHSSISQMTTITSKDDIIHQEIHRTEIDDVALNDNSREANEENGLQFEAKPSSDLFEEDSGGEVGKLENHDIADDQCREGLVATDISSPKDANNCFESQVVSEDVSARKATGIECTNADAPSGTKGDIKDEINNNSEVREECIRIVGTVSNSQQSGDSELLLKSPKDPARKDLSLSPPNIEHSTQCVSAVEDNRTGEPGEEASEVSTVLVQGQNGNNLVQQQLGFSGIDASVDSSSCCDSLEGNWGSVSVLSLQSDALAVIDAEALSSTDLLPPTEAGKSNVNTKATSEGQRSEKSEMFEPPSFMTLVEHGHSVGSKDASSGVQKGQNPQQLNSTSSQTGWFPTLSQVVNESQGRKKNEEIITKVTNWSTSKQQHTPLKSLLGEASHSNKPKSPQYEENPVNQKNGKVPKDNTSGLTTVNSILGPESPAGQVVKVEAGKEWNSPARYPAELKREKKVKSRPYWIQFVCCSSVDPQRS